MSWECPTCGSINGCLKMAKFCQGCIESAATIARLQREAEGLRRERDEARRVQSTRDKLAFPLPSDGHTHGSEPGMTLREYFAAKAFPALIQSLAMRYTETGYSDESAVNHAARYAAHAADALIEHLSHPDSETHGP